MNNPNDVWTQTPKGYSAEISTLTGDGDTVFSLPPNGYRVAFSRFKPHRDREGELTHWTYATEDGNVYTIFND